MRSRKPGFLELGRRKLFGQPARPVVGPVEPAPDPSESEPFEIGVLIIEPRLGQARLGDRVYPLETPALKLLLMLKDGQAVSREQLAVRIYGRMGTFEHHAAFSRQLARVRHVLKKSQAARVVNGEGDTLSLQALPHYEGPSSAVASVSSSAPLDWRPPSAQLTPLTSARPWSKPLGWALAGAVFALTVALILFIDKKAGTLWGTPEARQVVSVLAVDASGRPSSDPSFSGDGEHLLYVVWLNKDHSQVVDLNLTSNQSAVLTDGHFQDRYPQRVPKHPWIVFERVNELGNCELLSLNLSDQHIQKLSDCDNNVLAPFGFMPDGEHLTFSHRAALSLPRQLISVTLKDQSLTGVTNPISGMPGDSQVSLSKDGQTVVFNRSKALGVDDLWALSHRSSGAIQLTHDLSPLHGLAFDYFDQSVVFSSERAGHAYLWRSHLDGFAPELLLPSSDELVDPSVHPSGLQVAFTRLSMTTQSLWLGKDNQKPTATEAAAYAGWPQQDFREPAFDQTGQHVVGVVSQGGHDQLALCDTSKAVQLITKLSLTTIETPIWSPDQHSLLFSGYDSGQFNLYRLSLTDQTVTLLINDARSPSFSHDGQALYYASRRTGHWQIYKAPWPNPHDAIAITHTGGIKALEGPDGHSIYYTRADRAGLWQKDLDNATDERLLIADLKPIDWRNFAVDSGNIWLIARQPDGPARLLTYGFNEGRVIATQTISRELEPRAGLIVITQNHGVVLQTIAEVKRQVEIAILH